MNGSEDLRYEDTMYYEIAKDTRKAINSLFDAFNAPGRFRLKVIKVVFPEIVRVATELRENCLWKQKNKIYNLE